MPERSGPGIVRSPVRDLSTFAGSLRGRGLTVTPDQVGDMARALSIVDPADRGQVHAALQALSVTGPDQRVVFDEEFVRFFDRLGDRREPRQDATATPLPAMHPIVQDILETPDLETTSQEGASATESLRSRDFAEMDEDELAEARRLVFCATCGVTFIARSSLTKSSAS